MFAATTCHLRAEETGETENCHPRKSCFGLKYNRKFEDLLQSSAYLSSPGCEWNEQNRGSRSYEDVLFKTTGIFDPRPPFGESITRLQFRTGVTVAITLYAQFSNCSYRTGVTENCHPRKTCFGLKYNGKFEDLLQSSASLSSPGCEWNEQNPACLTGLTDVCRG